MTVAKNWDSISTGSRVVEKRALVGSWKQTVEKLDGRLSLSNSFELGEQRGEIVEHFEIFDRKISDRPA